MDSEKQDRVTREKATCKECQRLVRKFPLEPTREEKDVSPNSQTIAEALYELHMISVHGLRR